MDFVLCHMEAQHTMDSQKTQTDNLYPFAVNSLFVVRLPPTGLCTPQVTQFTDKGWSGEVPDIIGIIGPKEMKRTAILTLVFRIFLLYCV